MNGIGRSPSLRGAAGLSRPGRGGGSRPSPQTSFLSTGTTASDEANEEEARAEHMSLMEELRSRVQKAETASEEYQRQLNLLQARLEESQQEQSQLEDRLHQNNRRIEELENDQSQAKRERREIEDLYETERTAMLQDQAEQKARVEGLQAANQRLKETLAQRETRTGLEGENVQSRSTSGGNEGGQFAPPSSLQRSNSREASRLVQQKDRVIESLRLELAEAQIKIMEMDSMGGSQVHELEKKLLEVKIANARLLEDNESFQLLLSEKTLNGDFTKTDAMQQSSGLGSLAEELGGEELEESSEGKTDDTRRFEAEIKSLKDQNKALALYIENIIGRLLQHKEFENILDKTPNLMSVTQPPPADTNKELPPPPPPKDEEPPVGFLQRARSVVAGPGKRPRPTSQLQPVPPPSTAPNEDPTTAPSIPLARSQSTRGRGHQRSHSEMPTTAPLVNQMYRGTPSTGSSNPLLSPGISPSVTSATRTSFFPSTPSTNTTINTLTPPPRSVSASHSHSQPEKQQQPTINSSSDSTHSSSRPSDDLDSNNSPPRTSAGQQQTNYTGAVMTQNRLRPLRLVQENPNANVEAESAAAQAARKKANRGSWMSWMGATMQRGVSSENHNPS